jgi:hypothetical protein
VARRAGWWLKTGSRAGSWKAKGRDALATAGVSGELHTPLPLVIAGVSGELHTPLPLASQPSRDAALLTLPCCHMPSLVVTATPLCPFAPPRQLHSLR